MNKQINFSKGSLTRTLVGMSMMALAMSSIAACGSKKEGGSSTDTNTTTTTGSTTAGTTTGTSGTTTGGNVTTTGGGNTTAGAGISGDSNGVAVSLTYASLAVNSNATNPNEMYSLTFLSYNPYCFYAANPDPNYTSTPNSFDAMVVYLGNAGAAPTAGTYTVDSTTGMSVNPNSGFEQVADCVAPGSALSAGSVTLTAVDTTAGTASGTVNLTLSNGAILSGSFSSTAACPAGAGTVPNATPVCTTITYK